MTRTCRDCGQDLPLHAFRLKKTGLGRKYWTHRCKKCEYAERKKNNRDIPTLPRKTDYQAQFAGLFIPGDWPDIRQHDDETPNAWGPMRAKTLAELAEAKKTTHPHACPACGYRYTEKAEALWCCQMKREYTCHVCGKSLGEATESRTCDECLPTLRKYNRKARERRRAS